MMLILSVDKNNLKQKGGEFNMNRSNELGLLDKFNQLGSQVEQIEKENKLLKTENQVAEFYTEALRQQSIEKDLEINKLKEENKRLVNELRKFIEDQDGESKSNDFFLDILNRELNHMSVIDVINEMLEKTKWNTNKD